MLYKDQIIACGVSRDSSQEKQSYFTAIFVNSDYRGKGIGRALIRFLEQDEWCLDSDIIEVPSSKSSHGFYHKLGYEYWICYFVGNNGHKMGTFISAFRNSMDRTCRPFF
ncbi:MAG: GNAT family N-acetyltransferase [Oscillospiraceae bacterium]